MNQQQREIIYLLKTFIKYVAIYKSFQNCFHANNQKPYIQCEYANRGKYDKKYAACTGVMVMSDSQGELLSKITQILVRFVISSVKYDIFLMCTLHLC